MSSFPILDLVAGMIFIYFLLSIISSSAVEIGLTLLRVRAKFLGKWLLTIFDKPVQTMSGEVILGQAIMDHCSITALSGQGRAPSYIDAKNFVSALLEKVSFDPANPESIASNLDEFIDKIKNSASLSTELKRVILTYAQEARDTYKVIDKKTRSELDMFREKLETWFDSSMDRVSGRLKRKYMRPLTFWIALFITALMNADSIAVAKFLYRNPEVRSQLAQQAYTKTTAENINKQIQALDQSIPDTGALSAAQVKAALKARVDVMKDADEALDAIPLGWSKAEFVPKPGGNLFTLILSKVVGLAATILAIMMGAPFWFDVLNKVSNLRGVGTKPARTEDKEENK